MTGRWVVSRLKGNIFFDITMWSQSNAIRGALRLGLSLPNNAGAALRELSISKFTLHHEMPPSQVRRAAACAMVPSERE